MPRLNYYRTALYLCAVIALTDAIWILFFVLRLPKDTRWGFIMGFAGAVITALGLLIRSNFIRWLGGVFMVIWAAALLWPLVSSGTAPFSRPGSLALVSYYTLRGVLSLLTAAILLLSKQFSYEFAKLRENDSKYIVYLRRLLIWAIIAAALIATFNDIVKLTQSP
jgi:hypothetical protein